MRLFVDPTWTISTWLQTTTIKTFDMCDSSSASSRKYTSTRTYVPWAKIKYFGYSTSSEGITPLSRKVQTIEDYPQREIALSSNSNFLVAPGALWVSSLGFYRTRKKATALMFKSCSSSFLPVSTFNAFWKTVILQFFPTIDHWAMPHNYLRARPHTEKRANWTTPCSNWQSSNSSREYTAK